MAAIKEGPTDRRKGGHFVWAHLLPPETRAHLAKPNQIPLRTRPRPRISLALGALRGFLGSMRPVLGRRGCVVPFLVLVGIQSQDTA
jgi:hypothetical protein